MRHVFRWASLRVVVASAAIAVAAPAALVSSASAAPEDPADYGRGASATLARGLAFDTCTAPSLGAMRAWRSSPYDTVNIYFGGYNRACQQPQLSRSWVRSVDRMGFGILPTYLSAQPRCQIGNKPITYTSSTAGAKGRSDARDAAAQARRLALAKGSALYADVEHFDVRDADCRRAVQRYLTVWTRTLHDNGYLAGAYLHLYSGLPAARDVYNAARHTRLDAVWAARWDGRATLAGWDGIPNRMWSANQRVKQYRGDHYERHGGVSINIDSNVISAPVATVARSARTTDVSLAVRSQPSTKARKLRTLTPRARVWATCRVPGEAVQGSRTWLRLRDGGFVTSAYVEGPGSGQRPRLDSCRLGFQTSREKGVLVRRGPTTDSQAVGQLDLGAMAWVRCQQKASDGSGGFWHNIGTRRWVSSAFVATGSAGYSADIPRCVPR